MICTTCLLQSSKLVHTSKKSRAILRHSVKFMPAVHEWVPAGNRSYPYSIATTWSISINVVRKEHIEAVRLFQLLCFLNPDGILIEFIRSGVNALDRDLQELVLDQTKIANALLELEKFSLVKWNPHVKTVSVHRLVQTVVKDEMSNE